jgi:hypothetical protein
MQSSSVVTIAGNTVISVSFWLWQNAFDNLDELMAESSTNFNSNTGAILIDPNSSASAGNFAFAIHGSAAGNYDDNYFPRPTAAAWHHYLLVFNVGSSGAAWVDAVPQTINYVKQGTGGANFQNYTWYFMSRAGTSLFNAGRLAEFVLWGNAALGQTEATYLTGGGNPLALPASGLNRYARICGNASPEPDQVINTTYTVAGTTQIAHPSPVSAFCGNPGVGQDSGWPALNSVVSLLPNRIRVFS